jgi:uncharacterized protein YqjF (DUF2071 family)
MTKINDILSHTSHRPFAIPAGRWQYYQEWNNALFLHWKVPFDSLRNCVPAKFNIDTFNGDCYVSLVAFTMQNIRPRNMPSVKFISDFHEINLRTYINNDNKKGVYFLNIEAEKYLSACIAKALSGLPYEKADIKRSDKNYHALNSTKNFRLYTEFAIGEKLSKKADLDTWLTERYCLYLSRHDRTYRHDIHHKEWEIKNVDIKQLALYYKIDNIILSDLQPDLVHYSDGVKVLAWQKQPI